MRRAESSKAIWAMGSLFEHLAELAEKPRAPLASRSSPSHPGSRRRSIATRARRRPSTCSTGRSPTGPVTRCSTHGRRFIYLPQGVPHAFRIRGDRPARVLALSVPGNIMGLYDEVGRPAPEHRLPGRDGDPAEVEIRRWNETGPRFGLEVVGPPIAE